LVADAVDLEGHALDGADGAGSGMLADLPDDALADLVVACGRVQSWAAGVQSHVVAERAARESHPLAHSSLVAQVSGELSVTRPDAPAISSPAEGGAYTVPGGAPPGAAPQSVCTGYAPRPSGPCLMVQERA